MRERLCYKIWHGKVGGNLVAFIDVGMEIDPNGISMILEHMLWYNTDIIVGSKRHPASKVALSINTKLIVLVTPLYVGYS